jgi:uncharacterized RDD family membrane protein YckC
MSVADRSSPLRSAGDKPGGTIRAMVTPEGVDLELKLATASERAAAFLIDAAIIVGVLIAFSIAVGVIGLITHLVVMGVVVVIAWLLGFFALRNFYFIFFELRPGAATPGKRMVGLRVTARNGGPLTADAVFARNAMREIEVYLPLSFLLKHGAGVDGFIIAAGLIWCAVFALFPLFNRDRLRVGDFVAGTWVVRDPRRGLGIDLAQRGHAKAAPFPFTPAQLDAYGVKELQVLEDVLRRNSPRVVTEVAQRIRAKIGWTRQPGESDWDFLDAYYTGLRTQLETRLLFGRRRRDKYDR